MYVQILVSWEKNVVKNKFNQISKEILLNYAVKNTSLRKNCKLIISYCFLMMVYKYCTVNCHSNYIWDESTMVFSFPKETDLKKRWIKLVT